MKKNDKLKKELIRLDFNTATKLLLLQGISLIENGLQFLEHVDRYPNENSYDMLNILRDRFDSFKMFAMDENECDFLIINRVKETLRNVQYGYKLNQKIQNELEELRSVIWKEKQEVMKDE